MVPARSDRSPGPTTRTLAAGRAVWQSPRWGGLLKAAASFIALWAVLSIVLRHRPPPGEYVFGALIGLLYAMIAFGLILVYRANRIINFAQAEIGSAIALLGVLLIKVEHVPYLLAFGAAIVAAVIAGFLVEVVVIRRFAKAPRLVLSVVTIGVALLFGVIQFYLPHWLGAGFIVDPFPPKTPFSSLHFRINPLRFDANSVVLLAVAGLVVTGLGLFFRRTDVGVAVRASAENADRARLLGISVTRLSTVVWVIAAVLSTLGVFLRIPIIGLPVGGDIGPQVLLYALAAAVIAKMENFSVALVAAVAIGITEQCIYYSSHDPGITEAVMLPVLLAAMLIQRAGISRGRDTGLATWALASEFRPIPPELRAVPEVEWSRLGLGALLLGGAVALPYLIGFEQQILSSVVVIYAIVAVSLVILTGWAGQISLGQWGFAGVGSAVAGGVAIHLRHTWFVQGDFFLALILAGLAGAAVSVVIGLPALRIQGLYLAVTTLAFALAVQVFLLSPTYFPWLLPNGLQQIYRPVLYGRYRLDGPRSFYYVCLVVLLLALGSATVLRKSRAGRVMVASRDNERGVQSYGVSVRAARLSAFAISGFWASVAGALFAYQEHGINNNAYGLDISFRLLTIVVIGGLTSLPGAMLGAVYEGVLLYGGFSPQIQNLASGVGVLLLLYFVPGGLAQVAYGARDNLLRYVARRRSIVVPSLLADTDGDRTAAATEVAEAGILSAALASVAAEVPSGKDGADSEAAPKGVGV
jgi:branched-chain amino acid transport system permease protein